MATVSALFVSSIASLAFVVVRQHARKTAAVSTATLVNSQWADAHAPEILYTVQKWKPIDNWTKGSLAPKSSTAPRTESRWLYVRLEWIVVWINPVWQERVENPSWREVLNIPHNSDGLNSIPYNRKISGSQRANLIQNPAHQQSHASHMDEILHGKPPIARPNTADLCPFAWLSILHALYCSYTALIAAWRREA